MFRKRLTYISLSCGPVFLQSPATVGHFFTNAGFAVKISSILARPANSKFRQWQLLRTDRAVLPGNNQFFFHFQRSNQTSSSRFCGWKQRLTSVRGWELPAVELALS